MLEYRPYRAAILKTALVRIFIAGFLRTTPLDCLRLHLSVHALTICTTETVESSETRYGVRSAAYARHASPGCHLYGDSKKWFALTPWPPGWRSTSHPQSAAGCWTYWLLQYIFWTLCFVPTWGSVLDWIQETHYRCMRFDTVSRFVWLGVGSSNSVLCAW